MRNQWQRMGQDRRCPTPSNRSATIRLAKQPYPRRHAGSAHRQELRAENCIIPLKGGFACPHRPVAHKTGVRMIPHGRAKGIAARRHFAGKAGVEQSAGPRPGPVQIHDQAFWGPRRRTSPSNRCHLAPCRGCRHRHRSRTAQARASRNSEPRSTKGQAGASKHPFGIARHIRLGGRTTPDKSLSHDPQSPRSKPAQMRNATLEAVEIGNRMPLMFKSLLCQTPPRPAFFGSPTDICATGGT